MDMIRVHSNGQFLARKASHWSRLGSGWPGLMCALPITITHGALPKQPRQANHNSGSLATASPVGPVSFSGVDL